MGLVVGGDAQLQTEGDKVITISDFEIETEVHDPDRGMGTEWVHIVTGYDPSGEEVVWHVYEYPDGDINHVEHPRGYEVIKSPSFSAQVD